MECKPFSIDHIISYTLDILICVDSLDFIDTPLIMCWSKDVSYATFATGTLLNLAFATLFASFRRYDLVLLLVLWEYALLMQLPEAAAWEELQTAPTTSRLSTLTAFALNVTQPVAAWIVVAWITQSWTLTPVAWVMALVYIAQLVHDRARIRTALERGIQPQGKCDHLQLDWWTTASAIWYNLLMVVLFLHLPVPLFWITFVVFEVSLGLAFVWKRCGVASLWCWSIACASVVYGVGWGAGVV